MFSETLVEVCLSSLSYINIHILYIYIPHIYAYTFKHINTTHIHTYKLAYTQTHMYTHNTNKQSLVHTSK